MSNLNMVSLQIDGSKVYFYTPNPGTFLWVELKIDENLAYLNRPLKDKNTPQYLDLIFNNHGNAEMGMNWLMNLLMTDGWRESRSEGTKGVYWFEK